MSDTEFKGIFTYPPGTPPEQPVMQRPARVIAASAFIREVADMLSDSGGDEALIADWVADKMERFGARTAQPCFDMDGNGPNCSWCGMVWPLCGHYHQSEMNFDGDSDD